MTRPPDLHDLIGDEGDSEERFRRGAILEVAMIRDSVVSFELVPTRIDDRGAPRIVTPESSYLPGKPAAGKPD